MKLNKVSLKKLSSNKNLNNMQTRQIGGGASAYSKDFGACHTAPVFCPTKIIC
ncbi:MULTISPECIES: hypothetical protein [Pseudoalteromonas]|uniref:Uncharacterized protein n=1 Tax=Pseudoalteromonas luteoviolacea (strain 2ta16) TaxID=1353533 RepID=V4HMP8_PSEL2|nr:MULTISPECIES: hypothetical protein [Pseudoalteromonas]ESP92095.1 hypothetical protein PL2TA16_04931 [Pseudoalteromonas luteoviolacea 2ta16]KZN29199.1 hypothetical protein N483_07135 [Pseudoalteromonas luteoviolacea NCIMB 1944]MCG7546818.1 hypothetical protein [Pseudoalteromonas sp. Of7M-16]